MNLFFVNRVASTGVIKVADFGLTEDVYQRNYFRQDASNIRLPIKWMALESLHDRLFSEKSDVVRILPSLLHYRENITVVVIWSNSMGSVQSRANALSCH